MLENPSYTAIKFTDCEDAGALGDIWYLSNPDNVQILETLPLYPVYLRPEETLPSKIPKSLVMEQGYFRVGESENQV
jgi:hypothetical protein